ncbi:MAG TPA: protein kinase, partial [Pirellulaceae bacterium]|nr:protein kinase [Pirellulaceae bacterium]
AGWNYIVFEFIEGTNLRDLVDEHGPLSLEDALNYTLQIAEALAHSSSRDVVHRDIKPSNVLVTAGGQAKLVDMGLARLHQVESSSDDLTASGVTLGTFDYISPEQARDPRAADVRSDIYSLGCTLFYLLAGQPPFPEGTALQKLLRHNDEERPDVRQFREDLPPPVIGMLAKMLAKRPSQRYQTPNELIAELVILGRELGMTSITQRGHAVLPAYRAAADWRMAAWQIGAAVLLLAAAVAIVESWLSAGDEQLNVRMQPTLSAAAEPAVPADDSPTPGKLPVEPRPAGTPVSPAPATASPQAPSTAQARPGAANVEAAGAATPAVESVPASSGVTPPIENVASAEIAPIPIATHESAITPPVGAATIEFAPAAAGLFTSEQSAGLSSPNLPRKISRLVVAPEPPAVVPQDVEYVTTLAEACKRAAELALGEIELQWNGRQVESPLDIASQRMTLRASAGYQPVVVFQPAVTGLESDRRMVRLLGGSSARLAVAGVELRLELPTEVSYGWSLFSIQTGQSLELADCVLTVQNPDQRHTQVAMIDVRARRVSDTMTMGPPQPAMVSRTRLSLDRCVARGEAAVIAMAEETPITVRWNQGLVATPAHFMETGGTVSNPTSFEPIYIDLTRVTAWCGQGVYQMRRRPGAAYQLSVDARADHCIFKTDADAPLYEFIGVPAVAEQDLQFDGEYNLYTDPEVIFLRRRGDRPGDPVENVQIKQPRLLWSQERNLQAGRPWIEAPDLTIPAYRLTTADFAVDEGLSNGAGFDEATLPDMSPPPAPDATDSSP